MSGPLRGALIGCGFFARNHLHAWAGLEDARIEAVCDLDPERARAAAERFGAEPHTDAEAMLARGFDFVDVATQVGSHRALVELAVRHAATVICQKPFAETMEDGRAMVAAAGAAGATLMVHENFRWQRPFVAMREMVEAGRIGTPRFARLSFRHGYDNYRNQPYLMEVERFAIMDVGLHLFDLARVFMGEARDVACVTQRRNPRVRGEDAFTALSSHEGGACVCDVCFQSVIEPEPFPNTVAWIEGDAGTLELGADMRLRVHGSGEVLALEPEVPPWGGRPWHGPQDSVVRFQAHAIDVMRGRAAPQPSGADNLRTLALALAAYEAAEGRRTVAPEAA